MPSKEVDTAAIFVVGPLIDDTDFKTREAPAYNAAGMDVVLHEETQAAKGETALTPTTGGSQDWNADSEGYAELEITAAQLDTVGTAWVGGVITGVLPFESVHYDVIDPSDAGTLSSFLATLSSGKLTDTSFAASATATIAPQIVQSTTIATLSSQTSFTLNTGSADDDAYNGSMAVVTDVSTSTQKAIGLVSDYTGATKTVTLVADPGIFTMAATDQIDIIAVPKQLPDALSDGAGGLPISDAGGLGLDTLNSNVTAILADTNELQTEWADGGRLDLILDARAAEATVTALNDLSAAEMNAEVVDVLRTDAIPDSINADGAAPTIAQAIYGMYQFLTERAVAGTTVTVNKPDGTSALMTLTLDDANNPSSITRAT